MKISSFYRALWLSTAILCSTTSFAQIAKKKLPISAKITKSESIIKDKAPTKTTLKIDYTEYDLPNGLHVILHKDNSTPIVVTSVMYHVGSKNEVNKLTGFAHFFEHLLFEGSENVKRGEFDKYLDEVGAVNNANTTQDRTYYYEILPSNSLETALWLESERMLHAKVENIGIETQRKVVKEERRMRYDNQPYGTFMEQMMKRAYTTHPYQWTPIGSMDDIDAAQEKDYKKFYKTYYVPNNATLVLAGDIDIEQTKQWVKKYFGDIPKGADIPKVTAVEPPQTKEIRDIVYDNVQLPGVFIGYHLPAQTDKDAYAVELLVKLLADGESSRLHKTIVDSKKALESFAFPMLMEHPGLGIVGSIANSGTDVQELENMMNKEVEKLQQQLVSDKELQKVKNQIEKEFIDGLTSIESRASQLATYYSFYDKQTSLVNNELDRYLAIMPQDIQAVAKKYFTVNNRTVLHWLPKK